MVAQVVDNNHILNFPIFHHLIKDFLVEVLALSHSSIGISPADIVSINQRSLNCIVFVHVPQAYGLADRWLIMDTFAAVSVTTCTHFVEKWTIYFVHLCAVDLGKSVSHQILQQTSSKSKFQQGFRLSYQKLIIITSRYKSMGVITMFAFILVFQVTGFTLSSTSLKEMIKKSQAISQNLKDEIKYSGKGFGPELQAAFSQAISDASIFYKEDYFAQASYINSVMKKVKAGDWHVIIVQELNISKITEVSTGFYYWTDNDTWALWYSTSPFAKNILHFVIYNGEKGQKLSNVTTKNNSVGSGVDPETAKVIDSIARSLDTAQDIAKYIQKYDKQNWSVISIPFFWGGKYPQAWASLSVSDVFVSYNKNVTLVGKQSSVIIYV